MSNPSKPIPAHVLIAEPDPDIRRMLAAALRRWGVTGHFAATGPEAIDLFRQNADQISLTVLEVKLPQLDGPSVLAAIREIQPGVRFWFVGGTDGQYSRRELLDRGAEGLLSKPFDLESLRKIVDPTARPD
jgi:CheY-like chemotaxis protein